MECSAQDASPRSSEKSPRRARSATTFALKPAPACCGLACALLTQPTCPLPWAMRGMRLVSRARSLSMAMRSFSDFARRW